MEEIYDSKFVYFLMLEVLGKDKVICNDIQENRFDFAKQLFAIRLCNKPRSLERMEKFIPLLTDQMNELKKRLQNKAPFETTKIFETI